MAHRFIVPDSSPPGSPAPSTPGQQTPQIRGLSQLLDNHPSTTPAGPPPSSVASFTPTGAPSDAYLGSSIMRNVTGSKPPSFGGGFSRDSTGRNLFGSNEPSNAPLGRSIRGTQRAPSNLSRQYSLGDIEPEEEEDEDAEGEDDVPFPQPHASLFRSSNAHKFGMGDDTDDQIDRLLEQDMGFDNESDGDDEDEEPDEVEQDEDEDEVENVLPEDEDESFDEQSQDETEDMFLNLRHDDRQYGQPPLEEDEDLLMLNTPAATKKIRKEAQDLLRRSTAQFGASGRKQGFQYATIAKDMYSHADIARLTEPAHIILKTEDLVCRMYDDGIGTEDDEEKMDNSLANITYQLVRLWTDHVASFGKPEEEDMADVGPGPNAEPFEKATYVAQLLLRLHHTRYEGEQDADRSQPLPGVLLHWLRDSGYNPYPDQVEDVMRYQPSPACHSLYWQTVQNSLLRGDVQAASRLLRSAGWDQVRRGTRREKVYTGQALENVKRFTAATSEVLDQCPSQDDDWDILNSSWSLFRIQARGALDRMTLFAEGRGQNIGNSVDDEYLPEQESMSTMARKASSQLPWEVYENLQNIFGILLGNREAIVETAQDWCEATIGMFCWWEDDYQPQTSMRFDRSRSLRMSASRFTNNDEYLDRLNESFHAVIRSELNPNSMNPVEVAVASIFEGNVDAVIGLLRTWSLPIASSVAEVASLGQWLPPTEAARALPLDTLDMEDLALLNISQPGPDELLGMKDDTLEKYARELAGIEHLSPQREGWELAIEVLGRMDQPAKSEEIVGELLKDILATLDETSSPTVDKMWRILNDLGMINYAEETAEVRFAEWLCWIRLLTMMHRLLLTPCQRNLTDTARHYGTTLSRIAQTRCGRCSTFSCRILWFSRRRIRQRRTSTRS